MERRRDLGLVQRARPVLDAQPAAVERVCDVGDVAGGEDAGNARLQVLVDEDAVVDREPGRLGELDARGDADADDDEVAVDRAPVVQLDALDARFPGEGLQAGAGEQLDAVVAVDLGVEAADLAAEDVLERDLGAFDDRDLASDLARGGGDLGADPAGSDDDQVRDARTAARAARRRRRGRAGSARRRARRRGHRAGAGARRSPAAGGRSARRSPSASAISPAAGSIPVTAVPVRRSMSWSA